MYILYVQAHMCVNIYTYILYTHIRIYVLFSLRVYIKDIYCSNFVMAITKHIKNNRTYTESEE